MDQAMAKHWGYNVNKTQSKGLNDAKDISERPHLTHRTPTQGCGHTTLLLRMAGPGSPPEGTKTKVKQGFLRCK